MTVSIRLPAPWEPADLSGLDEFVRDFGPLSLSVRHGDGQWWIKRRHEGGGRPSGPRPDQDDDFVRLVSDEATTPALVFEPLLADRPIVARPEVPLGVVPGARVKLRVSTPLWVHVLTASGRHLVDMPTTVLKDTWFGPNTRVGELCYAARTSARVHLGEIARTPARAVTVVEIVNRTDEPFPVTRVKIPAKHLDLYVDRRGTFFTPSIRIVHEGSGDKETASIDVVPPEADGAVRVSEAREPADRGLFRSLGGLLG